jgi:hemerythrin-like domain-containing protein
MSTKLQASAPDGNGGDAVETSNLDSLIAEARTLLTYRESLDPEAFRDPLAFLRADYGRQLRLCNLLDAFTEKLEAEPVKPLASALLAYLKEDLPFDSEDKETDLLPALERRCEADDGLEEIRRQLAREHELNNDLAAFMVDDLEALADGRSLTNPVRLVNNVREFSETQRRHVTWEDRVLLPLARQRLTPEDLAEIGRSMAARRGIAAPE